MVVQDAAWIAGSFVVLLLVVLLPTLGQLFGFSARLEAMSDATAQRYGLPVAAMRAHEYRAPAGLESSLLAEAECPVCLETGRTSWSALALAAPGGGGGGGGGNCGHFFCQRCAMGLHRTSRRCAICRAAFTSLEPLPDPHADAGGWFRVVDMNRAGAVGKTEVTNVLRLLFPAEHASGALARQLDDVWTAWDTELCGTLGPDKVMDPEHGLLAFFLRKREQQLQQEQQQQQGGGGHGHEHAD